MWDYIVWSSGVNQRQWYIFVLFSIPSWSVDQYIVDILFLLFPYGNPFSSSGNNPQFISDHYFAQIWAVNFFIIGNHVIRLKLLGAFLFRRFFFFFHGNVSFDHPFGYVFFFLASTNFDNQSVLDGRDFLKIVFMYNFMAWRLPIRYLFECMSK